MTMRGSEKDVRALRTAVVCVGLSGVLLGVFVILAEGKSITLAVVCMAVGALVALLGVMRWPAAGLSRPRRIFVYWALAALLVLELMIPLNYASSRRRLTFDWTEGGIRSLSERTVMVLTRVKKPLRITTFFVHQHPIQGPVFNVVRDLLDQYRNENPNIIIEHVDPSRETDRMLALQKQMNLEDLSDIASVVVQYGDARKDVPMWKLLPRTPPGMPPQQQMEPNEAAFHGEEEFTAAIQEVTEEKRKELYFTTGHNELSLQRDLAEIASELRRDNYRVVTVADLAKGVPDNCTVLLVIGPDPRQKFNEREIAAVAYYLGRGGKLFFAASGGGPTGLEPVLGDFGIYVGRNVIIDTSSGRATLTVPVAVSGWHDVVNNLRDFAMRFEGARTVEEIPPPPGAARQNYTRALELLTTGRNCWAETDFDGLVRGEAPRYDRQSDKQGPVGVAALHEQPDRMADGTEFPKEVPRTRIVAVGSGDFMVGRQVSIFYQPPPEANVLFFFNAVNWLAEKTELISIPPKRFDFRPMDKLTAADATRIFWTTAAAMPALILIVGGVIWLVRRRG